MFKVDILIIKTNFNSLLKNPVPKTQTTSLA